MTSLARPSSTIAGSSSTGSWSYRRTFRASIFSSFLSPILFLTAMGIGLGALRRRMSAGARRRAVPRLPGAGAAGGHGDAGGRLRVDVSRSWPAWSGPGSSTACCATPISPRDIVLGQLALDRGCGWRSRRPIFTIVMRRVRGRRIAAGHVLAIPAAMLTGMASRRRSPHSRRRRTTTTAFSTIFRFVITPLFLFSGTFFPISSAAGRAPGDRLAHAAVARRRR